MIKRLPRPVESDESKFNREFYQWLNDSHYWIEENETDITCKWCGKIMPMVLNQSTLCTKNPEIVELINDKGNKDNQYKDKAHKYLINNGCKSMGQKYTAYEIEIMLSDFVRQLFNTSAEKNIKDEDENQFLSNLNKCTKDELIAIIHNYWTDLKIEAKNQMDDDVLYMADVLGRLKMTLVNRLKILVARYVKSK